MAVRTQISEHERLRRERGLSVTALAGAVGVTHPYVSQIEGGRIAASRKYREAVSLLLGVTEDVLFDEAGVVR